MAQGQRSNARIHTVWLLVSVVCLTWGATAGFKYHEHKSINRTEFPARCIAVLDGDTIKVEWMLGTNTVRMAGIDAPEVHDNKKLKDQAKQFNVDPAILERIGDNAKLNLEEKVLNRDITIIFSTGTNKRDAFGRLLCYIQTPETEDVGAFLLQNGFAYVRKEPHPRQSQYQQEFETARAAKRGIFAW